MFLVFPLMRSFHMGIIVPHEYVSQSQFPSLPRQHSSVFLNVIDAWDQSMQSVHAEEITPQAKETQFVTRAATEEV